MFYVVSVTGYISFRKETLSQSKSASFRKYLSLFISILSGLFSLLSKENAAILPITLLLIDYLFFYNLTDADRRKKLERIYVLSFFLLLVLVAYFGTKPLLSYLNGYGHRDFSLTERLLTEPRIVFFYLYLILFPNVGRLTLNHDFPISKSITDPIQTLFALLAIVLLVAMALFTKEEVQSNVFCDCMVPG